MSNCQPGIQNEGQILRIQIQFFPSSPSSSNENNDPTKLICDFPNDIVIFVNTLNK